MAVRIDLFNKFDDGLSRLISTLRMICAKRQDSCLLGFVCNLLLFLSLFKPFIVHWILRGINAFLLA